MPNPTATVMIPYHALDDLIQQGPRAAQPDAADVTPGTLYSVTDEAYRLERSDGTSWALYSPTGGGEGGGTPDPHHATHEPGGSDALVEAAWTDRSNTFEGDQTVDGDFFVTGTVNPLTDAQRDRINQLIGDPTGSRTLMSSSYVSGLSLRHDEDLGHGRIACGNYDTQTYQPLLFEVESFQVHTGVSPAARAEHLRVHPSGGVTVGTGADHAQDPGEGMLTARGLDGTPLNASQLTSGTLPDARLSANVQLKPIAPADLPPYYDYREGTPINPPPDTIRVYAVDYNGFTFLEERDSAGRTIRTSRDTVAVGKVDEVGGIVRGQCVYVSGATGANRLLKKALATSRATTPAFGLAMESGAQNTFIRVLTSGLLTGLDTSAIAEGARVFLSETTPGALTVTAPVAPNLVQRVGWVLRQHATQGEIGVLPATALSEASWVTVHASMHQPGGRDPLTALDAGILTSGTVPDARLSANVARRDQANTFTVNSNEIRTTAPQWGWFDISAPAEARNFRIINGGQVLVCQALNDAGDTVLSQPLTMARNGDIGAGRNIYEKGRATPLGHYFYIGDLSALISGSSGAIYHAFAGQMYFFHCHGSMTATGNPILYLGSATPSRDAAIPFMYHDGTWKTGFLFFSAGSASVTLYAAGGATFPAGTKTVSLHFNIEVN